MKVLVTGASGMVGQGVLIECLADPEVTSVLSLGRSPSGKEHPKLREILVPNLLDLSGVQEELKGCDACFFCLGISSVGMDEAAYTRITYDVTLAIAGALLPQSPQAAFCYVSGASTDSTEKGRTMWARVKGKTENALLKMPFKAVFMFRPGFIQALKGVRTKTRLYRALYVVLGPLYPVWNALFPNFVTTTEKIGRAMLQVARRGAPHQILESREINALAG